MTALQIFAVLLLVAANAFFAATEFSLVAVRPSRVEQLVERGDPRARIVRDLIADMGRVVSGVQVGISMAGLLLGYLGEITFAGIIGPMVAAIPRSWAAVAAHGAALVIAFGLLTILQVILGELVPKSLSLARAERVALLVARPFSWFLGTFSPGINLLDSFAERIVRAMGIFAPHSHTLVRSAEELQVIVQQARDRGLLPATGMTFVQNALEFDRVQLRDIMVARPDIHGLPVHSSLEETVRMFMATRRSRLPVFEGSLDHVLGYVHIKDLARLLSERWRPEPGGAPSAGGEFRLRGLVRDALIVPETKLASELLLEFRARRAGLAMVVDEFGSILGLVTLEDLLEQMVGEIHDEFDVIEKPQALPDGAMIFDAALNVRDLALQYGISLSDDPAYETLGGFVLSNLGFIPRGGENFEAEGFRFTVVEMDRRRVSRVKIELLAAPGIAGRPSPEDAAFRARSRPSAGRLPDSGVREPAPSPPRSET